jgi:glycosyltransferase involved in cell wall biosynthesis
MKRIVSLTPSSVARDSRTFKQAASMTRLGYDSHVFEQVPSTVPAEGLPFTLDRGGGDGAAPAPPVVSSPPAPAAQGRVRAVVERVLNVPLTIAHYLAGQRDLARRLPAADLYYLHAYPQFPAVWLAARRRRTPYVYDAHDFYPEFLEGGQPTRLESWLMRRFFLAIESRCCRSAAAVVTVSDGVADLYEGYSGRRPAVVRNCAELRFLEASSGDVREAAGLGPDVFLLVAVGNHKPGTRAIAQAVEALALLPADVHLAFVGAGFEEFAPLARSLGVADRAHFLPPVPAPEVPGFIASADASLILYVPVLEDIQYALPNGLFSSIAAGLPVLYPELVEIGRLAREHDLGLPIAPSRPASIAAGAEALRNGSRLEAFRRNAEQAREVLNWEHEETVLAQIVQSAVAGRLLR